MSKAFDLRKELVEALRGGDAHATFDQAVDGMPPGLIGIRAAGLPHSAWELLEHLRISQNDVLQFSIRADYVSPPWPAGYWPSSAGPARESQWDEAVSQFRADLVAMEKLVLDEGRDLSTPFPWGEGQNLLHEALLVAGHTAYHVGQLVLVRRALGAWPAS